MNPNNWLIWTIYFSCIFFLIRSIGLPFKDTGGWIIINGFILVVTTTMLYLNFPLSTLISGSLWIIFVVIPFIGMRKVNQLLYQERYREGGRLMAILRWLHPADGWLEQPEIIRALELGHSGNMSEAIDILNKYKNQTNSMGRSATGLLYRMAARWEELLQWIRDKFSQKELLKDASLMLYYLRALGETGDLNGLVQELERCEKSLEKTGNTITLHLARMFAFAFCGQTEQVQKYFNGPLAIYSQNVRQFWLATSEIAAGNESVAHEKLLELSNHGDVSLSNSIAWRLSQSAVNPEQLLTESSKQILLRLENEFKQENKYSRKDFQNKKAYATYTLIGLNLLMFGLEIQLGGTENLETLYHLGAVVPEIVVAGQWWRLLNATFLHFGVLHLFMNMLGLYFIGTFVEVTIGIWRYLLSYFIAGTGSMLTVSIITVALNSPKQITVGASGAIMGMVGMMGAILLRDWHQQKSRSAAKRLQSVLFIIGLQAAFDLVTPQVSFVGHLSGAIIGFLTGIILLLNQFSINRIRDRNAKN